MQATGNRDQRRLELAQKIREATSDELFKFGITRLGCVGGLDTIGLPIYISVRPSAKIISINSGKSSDRDMARAGAVLEAMEMWAAENPKGESIVTSAKKLAADGVNHLEASLFQPARFALVNANTQISWEKAVELNEDGVGEDILVPSDMVWMVPRRWEPFMNFQSSSNSLASGFDFEDACLSALYEAVERDAWTLSDVARDSCQKWPDRVGLEELPADLLSIVSRIYESGLVPFVLDVTSDLLVPTFSCTIMDPTDAAVGCFSGYGCHLDAKVAMRRALLEAVQSRAVYISGSRDDLLRRSFLIIKKLHQQTMIEMFNQLPVTSNVYNWPTTGFETAKEELSYLIRHLKSNGIDKIYAKELYDGKDSPFPVKIVRVIAPQLEPAKFEHWQAGPRALAYFNSLKVPQNI